VTLLALAPLVALLVVAMSDGEVALSWEEGGLPRENVGMLFFFPVGSLVVRAFEDLSLVDLSQPLIVAVAFGVLAAVAALRLISDTGPKAMVLAIAATGMAYGWGLSVEANALVRPPFTAFVQTEVVSKRETNDGNYLTLAAPRYRGVPAEVGVSWPMYEAVKSGDEVCILVHHGVFGWRFWELDFCPS
jgi:hypothetical protein